jgi:hypothetical protein
MGVLFLFFFQFAEGASLAIHPKQYLATIGNIKIEMFQNGRKLTEKCPKNRNCIKMCQQFPKNFFSLEVCQIFVCINRGFLTKYSFLFFVVKILLKFSKEKTLAGTAINGTN